MDLIPMKPQELMVFWMPPLYLQDHHKNIFFQLIMAQQQLKLEMKLKKHI